MGWLISAAWEKGSKYAQHLNHQRALSFMAAAVGLMDFCDDFKDRKEVQALESSCPIPSQLAAHCSEM